MTRVLIAIVAVCLTAVSIGCKASAEIDDSTSISMPR